MWTWLYDEKRVISASRPPRNRVIQPWISNKKTLPTPSARRSTYNTPVLLNGEGRAPSQPPANPAGTKTWAACSREHSNQQSPHVLQPEQLLRRFNEAAGLHPLNPTICSFTGNNLRRQPSAGSPSGAQKGEAQGIAEELAVLAGAGSRRWVWLDLDATTGQGDAGDPGALAPATGPDGDAPAALAAGSARPAPDAPIRHQAPRSDQRFGLSQNRYTASKRRPLNPAALTRPPA